jgi:hypothetical protein
MMLIERLYTKNKNALWNYVVEQFKGRDTKTVHPLYVSDLIDQKYLSIMFNTDSVDDMVRFLVDNITMSKDIDDTQTIMLMRPSYLPLPRDRPKEMERFSIYIKVQPRYYSAVHHELLNHEYPYTCFPNYITYAFGDYDILMTVLARDEKCVRELVDTYLKHVRGIEDGNIYRIRRTELLTSRSVWREVQRSLLYIPPYVSSKLDEHYLYDIDPATEEYMMITGAMSDEL